MESFRLGRTHAKFAQFGLKPHFLDIFQQQFLGLLQKLELPGEREEEKEAMLLGFTSLTSFVIEIMNFSYGMRVAELRMEEKEKERERE